MRENPSVQNQKDVLRFSSLMKSEVLKHSTRLARSSSILSLMPSESKDECRATVVVSSDIQYPEKKSVIQFKERKKRHGDNNYLSKKIWEVKRPNLNQVARPDEQPWMNSQNKAFFQRVFPIDLLSKSREEEWPFWIQKWESRGL